MTRKRRYTIFDAPAKALGFENVDAMIRQRMLEGKRRMDIADELNCHINVISKRIFAHNPDLASGPDGLDRRHHFVVGQYKAGATVAEIGRIDKIGERRVRTILQAEEARTGETLIRPVADRNQARRPKTAEASVWNEEHHQRTPARDVDADNSGPPLFEWLAKMKPAERKAKIGFWQDIRAEALQAMDKLPHGTAQRRTAAMMAAEFGARLRIAQKVAA